MSLCRKRQAGLRSFALSVSDFCQSRDILPSTAAMGECLRNKVVLITGASTGIGAFTARYMAKWSPKLVLVARSPDKLREVQAGCEEAGCGKGNVATVTADLAKQEDLKRVVDESVSAFGQLDVLVNNAAAVVINDVEHTTPEGFDRSMAINVRAPFFLSQAAIPHLKKTQGSIVNISSIAAHFPFNDLAAYCISKAALQHFTRLLAFELAGSNVRVNAVVVGGTLTDTRELMAHTMGLDSSLKKENQTLLKLQPLGGECSMEDIAKVVIFLVSDLAAAVTGACLPADRGSLIAPPDMDLPPQVVNSGDVSTLPTQTRFEMMAAMAAAKKDQDHGH